MKKFLAFCGVTLLVLSYSFAQIPDGYYNAAIGKKGSELRTALFNIIKNHTDITYSGLWSAYPFTDVKTNGKIWDIYSDVPSGNPPYAYNTSQKCSGQACNIEGVCYNKEHTVPQSWFNGASPMYSDLFHIYPTDCKVNAERANYPYGEVETASWTSQNGSKLGTCSYSGYTATVFEPIDEFKGDIARTYFYMTVRYMNNNLSCDALSVFNRADLKPWALNMLLEWHNADPVSQKEIDRNNVIYSDFQHNRNPFIDCPELVNLLFTADSVNEWLPTCFEWHGEGIDENVNNNIVTVYPNPASKQVTVQCGFSEITKVDVFDVAGRKCLECNGVGERNLDINIQELKTGYYILKVYVGNKIEVQKLVVK